MSVMNLLLALVCILPAGMTQDAISVNLRECKFKSASPADLFGYSEGEERLFFYANGTAETTFKVPAEQEYTLVVKASCTAALNENAKFKLAVDGKQVGKETLCTSEDPTDYTFTATLKAGEHKLTLEFTNDVYKDGEYDRNFFVHEVKLKKAK